MKKKNSVLWINLVLVIALLVSLACPVSHVRAVGKAKQKKVLVVYFSATGTTETAAKKVKKAAGGKLYQIKAVEPYTAADLNYSNDNCRANVEQREESARPKIKGKVKKIRQYNTIYIGFPIWHGKEPMIIRTFLESYNLKGKKIVPFCTSGGSGISGSIPGVKASAKGARVASGKDLTDSSYKNVKKWVKKQGK